MKHGNYETLKETETRPGVFRRSFSGAGATLSWSRLEPGHTPRPHSHPHEQIVFIVEGTARFVVGNEEKTLVPGDLIVIPSGVEHFAETVGEEPVIDLSIFNPRRDDYFAADEG